MNRAGARNPSPARLKRDFARFAVSKIEMKSQRATFRSRPGHLSSAERHRRSESGAAVRRTRGGELGCSLGRAVLGRAVGRAFAVRRTAGPARWAFGPPPERAARTQKNWVVLWAELLRLAESRGPKPPAAEGRIASFAASLYPKPRRLRPLEERVARFREESSFSARSERRRRAPGGAPEDESYKRVEFLRFFEPSGLRAGPSAHPRSAQPETQERIRQP